MTATDETIADAVQKALSKWQFREVADRARKVEDATLLLKRQTWNTNRAVVVVSVPEPPEDLTVFLKKLRKEVAFACRFFPLFWGIGIQVVLIAPGIADAKWNADDHVARIDNQWAIVQSLFLIDSTSGSYQFGQSWGQVLTGMYQIAIDQALSEKCGLRKQ